VPLFAKTTAMGLTMSALLSAHAAGAAEVSDPGAQLAAQTEPATVQVAGPAGAHLELRIQGARKPTWEARCVAPCEVDIESGATYRIAGGGFRASAPFVLHREDGQRQALHVDGASKAWFVVGAAALSVGGAAMVSPGLYVIGNGLMQQSEGPAEGPSGGAVKALLIVAAVGVPVAITGLVLVLGNRATTVVHQTAARVPPSAWSDAWRRLPTWREVQPAGLGPTPLALPILNARF
jgi:hypothetical protein